MAIKYKIMERGNPADQTKPKKFYAQAVADGETTLKELAKRASQISTVSYTDTLAVVTSLMEVIPDVLADGKTVRLGELGSLFISNKSDGSETADKVNANNIKGAKVDFRPGADFKKLVKVLDWVKAK